MESVFSKEELWEDLLSRYMPQMIGQFFSVCGTREICFFFMKMHDHHPDHPEAKLLRDMFPKDNFPRSKLEAYDRACTVGTPFFQWFSAMMCQNEHTARPLIELSAAGGYHRAQLVLGSRGNTVYLQRAADQGNRVALREVGFWSQFYNFSPVIESARLGDTQALTWMFGNSGISVLQRTWAVCRLWYKGNHDILNNYMTMLPCIPAGDYMVSRAMCLAPTNRPKSLKMLKLASFYHETNAAARAATDAWTIVACRLQAASKDMRIMIARMIWAGRVEGFIKSPYGSPCFFYYLLWSGYSQ